ncbi:unnamed protein product [Brassica oleracea]
MFFFFTFSLLLDVSFSSFLSFGSSSQKNVKEEKKLLEKKKKVRRRLVFAVVTDIELVDPSSPVSVFTVVATITACHHTGHLSLFQSLSLFLRVLNLFLLLEGGQGRGAWWWRR